MISEEIKIGLQVQYCPEYGKMQNGIIKSISDDEHVFVVYHCNEEWDKYMDYTGQRTRIQDLKIGWVDDSDLKLIL